MRIVSTTLIKYPDWLKIRSRRGILIYSAKFRSNVNGSISLAVIVRKCRFILVSYKPQRQKVYLWICAPSEDSDQPVHSMRRSLRKHAYSNILKFLQVKPENFQIKILIFFAQSIDCGYSLEPPHRGGSNDNTQYMFFRKIRKIMCTLVNPSFTI